MGIQAVMRYQVSCDGDGCKKTITSPLTGRTEEYHTEEGAELGIKEHGWTIYRGPESIFPWVWCEDCAAEL